MSGSVTFRQRLQIWLHHSQRCFRCLPTFLSAREKRATLACDGNNSRLTPRANPLQTAEVFSTVVVAIYGRTSLCTSTFQMSEIGVTVDRRYLRSHRTCCVHLFSGIIDPFDR